MNREGQVLMALVRQLPRSVEDGVEEGAPLSDLRNCVVNERSGINAVIRVNLIPVRNKELHLLADQKVVIVGFGADLQLLRGAVLKNICKLG
jgi:hypothetical protein